jgi:hypothetical protein
VCFVGVSGIGKSTLINAVVAQEKTVAPSGGVGPLTALATEVRYSETARLRAEYHPRKHLWRVAAALNFQVWRERKDQSPKFPSDAQSSDAIVEPDAVLEDDERFEPPEEIEEIADPENQGAARRIDEFVKTARLMVAGNQNEQRSLEYLADALSVACSVRPRWGTTCTEEDGRRIARLSAALQNADQKTPLICEQGSDARGFREVLKEHAAGFLSPLIQRIEIGWPSASLKTGLVLIDLPGVGVAGDVYKKETQRFVRERARAVVLVVDRAGPTDAVMELLRTTGYWDRLLLTSDDPSADPCALILAVTRVDDVATEEWYGFDPDEEGRRPMPKAHVFDDVRKRLKAGMRAQFEHQIAAFTKTDGSADIRQGREAAVQTILNSLQIHPVSAIEYRRLLANNDDDRPFLQAPEQSGVPPFSSQLVALANARRGKYAASVQSLSQRFAESLWNQLSAIESSWQSDRAAEEASRIRAALDVVLAEGRRELDSRRASFRTFLNQTVPEKIKVAVHEAKDEAQKGVSKYLRTLQDAHWATLRAAVRRGGAYLGARHISLPSDIALRFQDPVAAAWSQSLLKVIRKETYGLASDMRGLVETVCEWAIREQEARIEEKIIETQRKLVSGQVERLRDVGKEAIEELRDLVKVKVVEAIEAPIREACRRFVDEGKDTGPGTKYRLLELFQQLAMDATDSASKPTERTLLAQYGVVNKDIRTAFEEWGDPLESVGNAIVARHEDRVRRSDGAKRTRVITRIEELRGDAPRANESAGGAAP